MVSRGTQVLPSGQSWVSWSAGQAPELVHKLLEVRDSDTSLSTGLTYS